MMRVERFFIILALATLVSGCGYRISSNMADGRCATISVPYVKGDENGKFTAALIREISVSGAFRVVEDNADFELFAEILDYCAENVGFRYDWKEEKDRGGDHKRIKLTNSLIPTESRVFVTMRVKFMDNRAGCYAMKPFEIKVSVDFDHDYYNSTGGVNAISLGQLTDYDAAYDASLKPLYEKMAGKIVALISNYW